MDYSFGIVPLQKKNDEWFVLLVEHLSTNYWSFPKGHMEPGETEREAASREFYEETGLIVDEFLPFEPLEEHFFYLKDSNKIDRTVKYFLASVSGKESLQEGEIVNFSWEKVANAHNLATFPEAKRLCKQVSQLLGGV